MKRIFLLSFVLCGVLLTACSACDKDYKKQSLPKTNDDKTISIIGGGENQQTKEEVHKGEGYSITVPTDSYRYEKDYDDGNLEEKWDHKKKDDVEIKVTTYKNRDAKTAQSRFLREHNDYIFEDLMGDSICGTELDGDTLWFRLHETDSGVYVVSWEYPRNTSEELQKELAQIAETFQPAK